MPTPEVRLDKIKIEIVTPKGRAIAALVDEVTAPGKNGEFGVMPGHLPLLVSLRPGLVSYRLGSETKRCAVGSGMAEAGPNKLVILTDEFIERDQIDPVVVRKELAEVEAKIESLIKSSEQGDLSRDEQAVLIERENWLAAQLELYGDPPAPAMRPFEEYGPPPPPEDEPESPNAGT